MKNITNKVVEENGRKQKLK